MRPRHALRAVFDRADLALDDPFAAPLLFFLLNLEQVALEQVEDLVPLLDVVEQRLALFFDDFDLLRERTEPLANFAEMPVGLALVRVLAPEHARDAERAQPLERIADVLHELVLLALRTQLRELAHPPRADGS